MYKCVWEVPFAEFISFFLNIPWKWNDLVLVWLRPNYFIFIGYLKSRDREGAQVNPPETPRDLPLVLSIGKQQYILFMKETFTYWKYLYEMCPMSIPTTNKLPMRFWFSSQVIQWRFRWTWAFPQFQQYVHTKFEIRAGQTFWTLTECMYSDWRSSEKHSIVQVNW